MSPFQIRKPRRLATNHHASRRLGMLTAVLLVAPLCAKAQSAQFQFTATPWDVASRGRVLADLGAGYAERSFRATGPERLEQNASIGVRLASRLVLRARAGVASADAATPSRDRTSVEGTLVVGITHPAAPLQLAVGFGAMRDYEGTGVAVGCLDAGWRASAWNVAGNLRLERASSQATSGMRSRDKVDVITSLGFMHRVGGVMRMGVEGVGQDLEGLIDPMEAEGGAKAMVGPALAFGADQSPWRFRVGGGPILYASNALGDRSVGVPRDLPSRSGYVIRTLIAYRW